MTSREGVIYGCDRIVEAFDLAPILGEISGLVCDLEAKTSQNDTNAQIVSVRSCSNGIKFGMNIGLYNGTDSWLRKFGGP